MHAHCTREAKPKIVHRIAFAQMVHAFASAAMGIVSHPPPNDLSNKLHSKHDTLVIIAIFRGGIRFMKLKIVNFSFCTFSTEFMDFLLWGRWLASCVRVWYAIAHSYGSLWVRDVFVVCWWFIDLRVTLLCCPWRLKWRCRFDGAEKYSFDYVLPLQIRVQEIYDRTTSL